MNLKGYHVIHNYCLAVAYIRFGQIFHGREQIPYRQACSSTSRSIYTGHFSLYRSLLLGQTQSYYIAPLCNWPWQLARPSILGHPLWRFQNTVSLKFCYCIPQRVIETATQRVIDLIKPFTIHHSFAWPWVAFQWVSKRAANHVMTHWHHWLRNSNSILQNYVTWCLFVFK